MSPNLSEIPVVAIFWLEKDITSGNCVTTQRAWNLGFPEAWPSVFAFLQKIPWFGSCQSGRTDGPPFVVWTFHFAVDPHARAHSRKKPIPHHYLWGALGSRFNLPSDLEEPLFHGVCYMFAMHLATMMIYSHMSCKGQTWSDLAKSCKIHTVRNLVTIPQDSSQLKGIAMPEGQFQPGQRWVKQYAKHC